MMDAITSVKPPWWQRPAAWGPAAVLSLAAGVVGAMWPGRSLDLREVMRWASTWDFGAGNPYTAGNLRVDYPPHAFVLIGPLHLLPADLAPLVFVCLNVLVCAMAAWLTVQVTLEGSGASPLPPQRRALVLMVLTFGVFRSSLWLGQLMPLSWLLLMMAVREAGRRPALAGVCLGIGAFKMNLALAVVAYLMVRREGRVLAWAAAVVLLVTTGVAWLTGVAPWVLTGQYLQGMHAMYGPAGYVPDWLSLRGLVESLEWQIAIAVYLVITGGLLAWATARGFVTASHGLALWCLWTLQAVSHQRFNLVLAVPAVLLLSPAVRAGTPFWAFLGAVVFLILDAPWVLLHAGWGVGADWASRVFVLSLFAWLGWQARSDRALSHGLSASV